MIVAFTGFKGSGKTTAAQHLKIAHKFKPINFKDPFIDMLRTLGLTDDEIDGPMKELPSDTLCGATPRHAMQTLGVEWGRNLIHDDIWVRTWQRRVAEASIAGLNIVTDDCRFRDEAQQINIFGGHVIKIQRVMDMNTSHMISLRKPELCPECHASETEMKSITPTVTIVNDGSVRELKDQLDAVMDQLVLSPREVANVRP